jgi:15-cis-phytoene synthase
VDEVEDQVRRGDADRWRTAMLAPAAARPGLMALYGLNLELARAPWVASEPALAAIRLAWWREAVAEIYEGRALRRHPVVAELARAVAAGDLPRRLFEGMIDARLSELDGPAEDAAAVRDYVDHTAGHLMELAARHLGGEGAALPVVRDFAHGAGMAALIAALPELRARGRDPLPAGADLASLAREGLAAIARARAHRDRVPAAAAPALLAGWQAEGVLRRAAAGRAPGGSRPVAARAALALRAFSGRW